MIRIITPLLFVLLSQTSFAQYSNKNNESMAECWKCISLSNSFFNDGSVEECQSVAERYKGYTGGSVAALILARQKMDAGDYLQAKKELKDIKFEHETMQLIIEGLLADCESELKNYKAAEEHYKRAALQQDHLWFSPILLFKAFLCSQENGSDGQIYLNTIERYYHEYYSDNRLESYERSKDQTTLEVKRKVLDLETLKPHGLGQMHGNPITDEGFAEKLEEAHLTAKYNKSGPIDEDIVWTNFIETKCLNKEFASLNITMGEDEFHAFLYGKDGFKVQPDIAQAFRDPSSGEFSPSLLQTRITEMATSSDAEIRNQWHQSKNYYRNIGIQEKYNNILKLGNFVTQLEAKNEYHLHEDQIEIDYQFIGIDMINHVKFDITEEDKKAYYEKHKNDIDFIHDRSTRYIKHIEIDLEPTSSDSLRIVEQLKALKADFSTSNE